MGAGSTEAINRIGPTLSSSGDDYAGQLATVATGASSAFIAIPNTGPGVAGGHAWITFVGDGDFHLAFGPAAMGAATVADMLFKDGVREDWEVPPNCTGFRIIRAATEAGTVNVYWHRSNG